MPNIEIHGYGLDYPADVKLEFGPIQKRMGPMCLESKAYGISIKISKALKQIGLEKESVINIVPSITISADEQFMNPMPFIRIYDDDLRRLKQIVNALKEADIGIDVEELLLTGFTQAENMKL